MSYHRGQEQFSVPVTVPQALSLPMQQYTRVFQHNCIDVYYSAHRLFEEGRYWECIHVANVLLASPNESLKGHGYLIIGACYYNLNSFDESIVYSKCAIECNPALAGAYYNLANALKAKDRLEEAKGYLHQGLQICPSFLGAHLLYASILARLGQLEDACRAYETVIGLCPNMLIAYYNLSVLQLNLHRYSECSRTYTRIAELLKATNEVDKALGYYREACKLERNNWELFFHYGLALKDAGKPTEAFQMFTSALRLNEGSAAIHFQIACIYDELGDNTKALEGYQKAIAIEPAHVDRYGFLLENDGSYNNMGNVLRRVKRWDEAISTFLKAIALCPGMPQLYNNLGNIYLDMVRLYSALPHVDDAGQGHALLHARSRDNAEFRCRALQPGDLLSL